jgi:aryl-alcohol dehydrogenase-like predicted oxidoreductase
LLTVTIAGKVVSRLGYGCFPLSGGYGPIEPGQGVRMIKSVLDAGIGLLDTSDAYAAGANEELVGQAVKGRRDQAVICTKFGWILDSSGKAARLDSSPARVQQACEASLKRLQTDYIDLYIQHRRDPDVPIEETVGALARLQEQGKVRSIGLSEASVETLDRANDTMHVSALQTEYSLWSREPEAALLPACTRLGVVFIAYSPLGRGFLSGTITGSNDLSADDYRRTNPRFQDVSIAGNLALVNKLADTAHRLGFTTSQLALAWLLAQPASVVPIPSTRSLEHFQDNLKALELELTPSELAEIGDAVPVANVQGERHPEDHMKTINR